MHGGYFTKFVLGIALFLGLNTAGLAQGHTQHVGPVSQASLGRMMAAAPVWQVLLAFALVPAVCEELAFRGFILSGLRHSGRKWGAILLSSVFFGLTHGILQQSITACIFGALIGYLVVQTGSLFPCMAFHLIYNTLSLLIGRVTPELIADYPAIEPVIELRGRTLGGHELLLGLGVLCRAVGEPLHTGEFLRLSEHGPHRRQRGGQSPVDALRVDLLHGGVELATRVLMRSAHRGPGARAWL